MHTQKGRVMELAKMVMKVLDAHDCHSAKCAPISPVRTLMKT